MDQKNRAMETVEGRRNLLNMLPADAEKILREFAVANGEKPFRGSQVVRHLWQNPAPSFAAMTDLPATFRTLLDQHFVLPRLTLATRQTSSDGTEKFLFRLDDGEFIETVAIPEGSRLTLCISSQAGCALRARWDSPGISRCSRSPVRFAR